MIIHPLYSHMAATAAGNNSLDRQFKSLANTNISQQQDNLSIDDGAKVVIDELLHRVNETLKPYALEFELHRDATRIVTRVVDRESGETIRQIPAEEIVRIAERLTTRQGLLLNGSA